MKQIKQFWRLIYINYIFVKYGLDRVVLSLPLLSPFSWLIYLNPRHWFSRTHYEPGEALRLALIELGPIFVKFGQMLSTRPDLLPMNIVKELALLQDKVPAYSGAEAQAIIEEELGAKIADVFTEFCVQPLASASIAQVHTARLHDGKEVVIKVLRPNVGKVIKRDIALMYAFTRLVERVWALARRLGIVELVTEFEKTILNELDLMREAANASQLRRNFKGSDLLYVPEIYWPYTSKRIMVMERIYGIPISDIAALKAAGVNFKTLAERGVEVFFTQVFRDRFFHADMHPGNIFVSVQDPEKPQYICVDMGIVGSLDSVDQRYLVENLWAFFQRDYQRVAQLHIESAWVPANTRAEEFEAAIRTVCEPIFERPLAEISFAHLIMGLMNTARQFNMKILSQLMLLQKTLMAIEGLGRQIYPDLDLWSTSYPFLERWMREQLGPKAIFKKLQQQAPFWIDKMPEIPGLMYDALRYVKQQQLAQLPVNKSLQQQTPNKAKYLLTTGFGGLLLLLGGGATMLQMTAVTSIALFSAGAGVIVSSLLLK